MHRSRNVSVAGLAATLLLTAAAAPASAALSKGTVAIVNGIPGARVDVCLGSREIRSGLPYGGRVWRTLSPGEKTLRVFRTDPRTCRGDRLARSSFELAPAPAPGSDITLVATRSQPSKVVIFDNAGLGHLPPDGDPISDGFVAWRHAADLGRVAIHYTLMAPELNVEPAAVEAPWGKGDEHTQDVVPGWGYRLRAARLDEGATVARSAWVTIAAGRRYEWYLLGTTRRNAKFVVFSRQVSELAP